MLARLMVTFFVLCVFPIGLSTADDTAPKKTIPAEPYFGQEVPDSAPAVFAEGIISEAGYRLHGFPAFSPDGREVFWPVIPPALMHMRLTDSGWTQPVAFETDARAIGGAWFSPDGDRVYFHGARPGGHGSLDIWYLQRTDDGWSAPIDIGAPPNSEEMESQPSIDAHGDVYFTGKLDSVGFNRGIYVSRKKDNGTHSPAVLLGANINTEAIDYTPFVGVEGDFLLFASSRPTVEESDLQLYVAFKGGNGSFSSPVNVSEALGWEQTARFPALSSDGRALFFLSGGKIYWVSADIINGLRPDQDSQTSKL